MELLDLDYCEDKDADVDFNLVMTGRGKFIEVQGTGEEATFSRAQLDRLLKLGNHGIEAITARQKQSLGSIWPHGSRQEGDGAVKFSEYIERIAGKKRSCYSKSAIPPATQAGLCGLIGITGSPTLRLDCSVSK